MGHKVSDARFEEARDFARNKIAIETWEEDPTIRIGTVAKEIQGYIAEDPGKFKLKKAPTLVAIKGWIRDLAPEAARKVGRPKQN